MQQATGVIILTGDVAAVKAAVDAAAAAAKSAGGEILSTNVIPQPHGDAGVILGTDTIASDSVTPRTNDHEINLEQAALAFGSPGPGTGPTFSSPVDTEVERLFNSPEARAIKDEICAVGRKLWQRSYVDGNGGNISCRIGKNAVICTPTLLSKADITPEDLCLVDLSGKQLAGSLPRTSEVFLHLEIYKHVPQANAVIHCHPPHATAYAITGRVPPTAIIPEFDVFVGSVAFTPYETPGTKRFAETVLPFVRNHNTILLGNHGIVCWADTPTHAEWYAENLETYCWTLLISHQLGVPYAKIPPDKQQDLLAIKKRLGLPDARFDKKEHPREAPGAITLIPEPGPDREKAD
jgi:L-fuculose-phosphate aldolase